MSMEEPHFIDQIYSDVSNSSSEFSSMVQMNRNQPGMEDTNNLMDTINISDITTTGSVLTQNMTACMNAEFYEGLYKYSGTFFQSFVFVAGIIGNMIVIVTVLSTKSLHNTTNSYLVSLAMADLITLFASCPQEIISYHMLGDKWIWGSIGCSMFVYLQYLGINVSALSLTAFTVERYIAVCHPMKAQYICTQSRAKRIIMYCWLFTLLYCSPWLFLVHLEDSCVIGFGKITKCKWRLPRSSVFYKILFFTDIILFYMIPLILTSILYSLIAWVLFRSRKFTLQTNEIISSTSKARVQVVKMLAAVVIIFACLWLPYRGMLVYNTVASMTGYPVYMDLWYLMFAKTCAYINSAVNPILYNAMSTKFRRAFKRILSCPPDYAIPSHHQQLGVTHSRVRGSSAAMLDVNLDPGTRKLSVTQSINFTRSHRVDSDRMETRF